MRLSYILILLYTYIHVYMILSVLEWYGGWVVLHALILLPVYIYFL